VHHDRENGVKAAVDCVQEWSNCRYFEGQHFIVATNDDLMGEAKKYDKCQVKMRSAAALNKGRAVLDALPLPLTPLTPLLSAQFAMVVMEEAQIMKNFVWTVFEAAMPHESQIQGHDHFDAFGNNNSVLNGSAWWRIPILEDQTACHLVVSRSADMLQLFGPGARDEPGHSAKLYWKDTIQGNRSKLVNCPLSPFEVAGKKANPELGLPEVVPVQRSLNPSRQGFSTIWWTSEPESWENCGRAFQARTVSLWGADRRT
jgi:hypothetical protein